MAVIVNNTGAGTLEGLLLVQYSKDGSRLSIDDFDDGKSVALLANTVYIRITNETDIPALTITVNNIEYNTPADAEDYPTIAKADTYSVTSLSNVQDTSYGKGYYIIDNTNSNYFGLINLRGVEGYQLTMEVYDVDSPIVCTYTLWYASGTSETVDQTSNSTIVYEDIIKYKITKVKYWPFTLENTTTHTKIALDQEYTLGEDTVVSCNQVD